MIMKENIEQLFRDKYRGNEESLQEVLLLLKGIGCTQLETVRLLINELNLSLKEADSIVLNSKAWEIEKSKTLKLRDDFDKSF